MIGAFLPLIGTVVEKLIGLGSEAIEDKDKRAEFEAQALRLKADMERAYLEDVQSARALTASLANTMKGWAAPIISLLITAGFFAMLGLVVFFEIPVGSREVAYILLGSLAAGFGSVVNFWLGSSVGSAMKTDAIVAAAKKAQGG